jgi:broad specificity phosphatase PhoE
MTRLCLVRHARPTSAWDAGGDPGLDDVGRAQANAMAARLGAGDPRPIVTSPLRRTRETAAALAGLWNTEAVVEPRVGEIPTPSDAEQTRSAWLRTTLSGRWSTLSEDLQRWREEVLATLRAFEHDAVVVTHFVAINAAVGAATGDDRVVAFSPDYASVTEVDVNRDGISLVCLGTESSTRVR